ncbi:hypothetical protein GKZ28_08055 [Clostridium chromiireducens]|jgi:hypothetical protein|uniref:Uncharacterized protein n=1 Tax=Clostridium chromiireducens TaxID=225345 RepID=A0A964RLA0_9CLOT|nr:hypothetical protein [Clostridium chromiireducens]MVX63647.1 hypothetical protein [Clostridium chromiireducens]
MATKLYNKHLTDIMENSKNYYILDTYIALAHMSMQIDDKFYIQTYSDSISNLVGLVKRYVKDVSYGAIRNAIIELMELNILIYNTHMDSFLLNEMENMLKKKNKFSSDSDTSKYVGYTHIQDLFFTIKFNKLKYREKRLLIYIFQLADSNANKNYGVNNVCNLLKSNSSWMNILKTKCLYYARDTIRNFLENNSDLFEDTSDNFKIEFAPKHINQFRFSFNLNPLKDKINKDGLENDKDANIVINNNQSEYSYIVSRSLFVGIELSKTQIMHIIRAASPLPIWSYKVELINAIINKLKASEEGLSGDSISSLPAYLFGITRRLMQEHKKYLEIKEKIIDDFNAVALES